jgi:predicted nuclease of predicted toxin-antitoxin system
MQLKLDEYLPPSAAELLSSLGHDVMTVYDQGLQSCTDPGLLAACQDEGKILLSLDLDFSNILVYSPERYAGLIVLRLHKPGPKAVLSLLRRVVPHLKTVPVAGEALDRG